MKFILMNNVHTHFFFRFRKTITSHPQLTNEIKLQQNWESDHYQLTDNSETLAKKSVKN